MPQFTLKLVCGWPMMRNRRSASRVSTSFERRKGIFWSKTSPVQEINTEGMYKVPPLSCFTMMGLLLGSHTVKPRAICVSRKPPLGKEEASGSPLISFFPVKLETVFPFTREITRINCVAYTNKHLASEPLLQKAAGTNGRSGSLRGFLPTSSLPEQLHRQYPYPTQFQGSFSLLEPSHIYISLRFSSTYANLGTDFCRVSSLNEYIPNTSSIKGEVVVATRRRTIRGV